jgi:hypothetical protein
MKYTPKEIAALLKNRPNQPHYIEALVRKAVKAAVDAEREACAKVCDDIDVEYGGEDVVATWCSAAIRARGNT